MSDNRLGVFKNEAAFRLGKTRALRVELRKFLQEGGPDPEPQRAREVARGCLPPAQHLEKVLACIEAGRNPGGMVVSLSE